MKTEAETMYEIIQAVRDHEAGQLCDFTALRAIRAAIASFDAQPTQYVESLPGLPGLYVERNA